MTTDTRAPALRVLGAFSIRARLALDAGKSDEWDDVGAGIVQTLPDVPPPWTIAEALAIIDAVCLLIRGHWREAADAMLCNWQSPLASPPLPIDPWSAPIISALLDVWAKALRGIDSAEERRRAALLLSQASLAASAIQPEQQEMDDDASMRYQRVWTALTMISAGARTDWNIAQRRWALAIAQELADRAGHIWLTVWAHQLHATLPVLLEQAGSLPIGRDD